MLEKFLETVLDSRGKVSANHIQGHTNAKHYYGLYSGEDLVSCMSFSGVRFETKSGFKLIRSATKKFHVVVGGFSKILKHKLGSVLETYGPELSERDNMFANGYRRFWNCGQLTFALY